MPSHPELVAAFRDGVRTGALPPGVTARDPAEAARRFAVYRNNVAHGLTEALASRFPVVERLVGAAFFRALARTFLEGHPPASPVLLAWGGALPRFLEDFPPVAGLPYLADVARLEMARGRAFHAADRDPLMLERLVRAAQEPGAARLRLHPSVHVIPSRYAVVSIWAANQPGRTPVAVGLGKPETALVLRDHAFAVPVRAIGTGDTAFVAALGAGRTLLDAAQAAASAEPGHDPATLLATLVQAGALTGPDTEDQP